MSQPPFPTRTLAGIRVADTPAITASITFLRAHSDEFTYNHCMRSWLFGAAMAQKLPHLKDVDLEVHAVSTILHDLGWDFSSDIVSKDKRFEVDGANAAVEFLKREVEPTWDERRMQLVWDSIALHTTISIVKYKEPVVALCSLGIGIEFMGPDSSLEGSLTWKEYDEIAKEFPRMKFIKGVREVIGHLCRTKPETTYDNFASSIGVRYVEGYTLEGRDVDDMFGACPLSDSF
ncbi:hypothetical protein MMC25_004395 [Agyrium rufum]|nr:hypothetical protein [Agyrium rufum]